MPRPQSYRTAQKESVLRFLEKNRGEHFTLESLCERLADEGASVGKTTVYRCLERLCAAGSVRKTTEGRSACYSYGCCDRSHYHLICRECGKLIHVDCAELDRLRGHFLDEHGFEIDPFATTISGRCADCIRSNKPGGKEKDDGTDR
ncbi:MAG: transcriptional repressor [Clostridia bacterium]|nr:transcriptional repressor [Clostridia bacterium]